MLGSIGYRLSKTQTSGSPKKASMSRSKRDYGKILIRRLYYWRQWYSHSMHWDRQMVIQGRPVYHLETLMSWTFGSPSKSQFSANQRHQWGHSLYYLAMWLSFLSRAPYQPARPSLDSIAWILVQQPVRFLEPLVRGKGSVSAERDRLICTNGEYSLCRAARFDLRVVWGPFPRIQEIQEYWSWAEGHLCHVS